MTYRIGQIVPRTEPRISALTGAVLFEPRWHILRVISGREAEIADRLTTAGVHVCYPKREVSWRDAQGRRQTRQVPEVAGYLFAKFRAEPLWRAMWDRSLIIGIVCRETPWGPVPYSATENDVRSFMDLPTVEDEIEAKRREALRVKPGDKARVLVGPMAEMVVMVTAVAGGRVFWEMGVLKGEASDDACERLRG